MDSPGALSILSARLPPSIASSALFRLPAKLRNRIYEYAISEESTLQSTKLKGILELALLETCKVIRHEAIGISYHYNTFTLTIINYHPAPLLLLEDKPSTILKQHGDSIDPEVHTRHLEFGAAKWDDLQFRLVKYHANVIEGPLEIPFWEVTNDEHETVSDLFLMVRSTRDNGCLLAELALAHIRHVFVAEGRRGR